MFPQLRPLSYSHAKGSLKVSFWNNLHQSPITDFHFLLFPSPRSAKINHVLLFNTLLLLNELPKGMKYTCAPLFHFYIQAKEFVHMSHSSFPSLRSLSMESNSSKIRRNHQNIFGMDVLSSVRIYFAFKLKKTGHHIEIEK